MKKFVAIGHITNDTEPYQHLGGSASYAAVAAVRLGYESHIITKCPPQHPYIQELESLGVQVHVLPSSLDTITTFQNFYDKNGKRKQIVTKKQEMISKEDKLPQALLSDSLILAASVVGEVDTSLFPLLATYGFLAVTAQGYLRRIGPAGEVYHCNWNFSTEDLASTQEIILSEEDLTIDDKFDTNLFQNLLKSTKVVLTKSDKGASVFEKDDSKGMEAVAFQLQEAEIKDLTGAGDSFAAAFLIHYDKTKNAHESAVFANLFAALKIMAVKGIGIESIPGKEEVDTFIINYLERVKQFFERNKVNFE